MNIEKNFEYSQKFTFPLKARTEKKRILEAKEKLSAVFPFKIQESNIYLSRSDKKGFYDVYISDKEIKNEKRTILLAEIIILILVFISILFIAFNQIIKASQKAVSVQREIAYKEAEELKLQKEKQIKLENLKKQYEEISNNQYEKIYFYIELLYSVMPLNTTIENLSIEGKSFSVEVTTSDATKILQNFERNMIFSSVKMNRSTVNKNSERVSYVGKFSFSVKEPEENLSTDQKISFYEKEITFFDERKNHQKEIAISEYIKNIRNIMHKYSLNEQYIQLKGNDKSAEIEFFVYSNSQNLLRFIKEIQNENNSLVDIKHLVIRNSEMPDKIQTTIIFDSGIETQNIKNDDYSYSDKKYSAAEINKIFYKTPIVKKTEQKNLKKPKEEKKSFSISLKKLSFIGLTKIDGKTFVMAKDDEMQSIYRIPLTNNEAEEDFCIEIPSGYKAKIKGEYYEVKR